MQDAFKYPPDLQRRGYAGIPFHLTNVIKGISRTGGTSRGMLVMAMGGHHFNAVFWEVSFVGDCYACTDTLSVSCSAFALSEINISQTWSEPEEESFWSSACLVYCL